MLCAAAMHARFCSPSSNSAFVVQSQSSLLWRILRISLEIIAACALVAAAALLGMMWYYRRKASAVTADLVFARQRLPLLRQAWLACQQCCSRKKPGGKAQ